MNDAILLAMLQNPDDAQAIAEFAESEEGKAFIEQAAKEGHGS